MRAARAVPQLVLDTAMAREEAPGRRCQTPTVTAPGPGSGAAEARKLDALSRVWEKCGTGKRYHFFIPPCCKRVVLGAVFRSHFFCVCGPSGEFSRAWR